MYKAAQKEWYNTDAGAIYIPAKQNEHTYNSVYDWFFHGILVFSIYWWLYTHHIKLKQINNFETNLLFNNLLESAL